MTSGALLAHGYTANLPAAVLEEVIRDWCDALESFSRHSIEAARREWIRDNPDRRPAPGHIAAICRRIDFAALPREEEIVAMVERINTGKIDYERRRGILRELLEQHGLTEVLEPRMLRPDERRKRDAD